MDFWEFIDSLPPFVFDILELIIPLGILTALLFWMFRDIPPEARPWNFFKRRITGNLTEGEIEKKKADENEKVWLKMMASNFAFTNVPRILLGVVFALFVLSFAVIFILISPMVTDDWTPTDATVVATGISDHWCHDNLEGGCHYDGYFPRVIFSWEVDGQTYHSDRYTFDANSVNFSSRAQAEAWLEDYPAYSNTTAYFDPDQPSEAVLITHNHIEAYGASGHWFGQIIFSIMCLPLPIMFLYTVRQFEKALPEHRGKRFKMTFNSANQGWEVDNADEHAELVSMARSAYLKKNYEKYGEEAVEAASQMAHAMDMERMSVGDGPKIFTIINDGVEEQVTIRSLRELFNSFPDDGTIFLEDSKEKGRYVDIKFIGEIDGDDHLQIKEFNGDELVLDETINVEKNYARALEIMVAALEKTTAEDDQWWG